MKKIIIQIHINSLAHFRHKIKYNNEHFVALTSDRQEPINYKINVILKPTYWSFTNLVYVLKCLKYQYRKTHDLYCDEKLIRVKIL